MNNPYEIKKVEADKYTGAQISLQNSLIQLLLENKIAKINVRQLCQKATVARSSFYAYYENISILLDEVEDNFVSRLAKLDIKITDHDRQVSEDFEYLSMLIDFGYQEKTLINALLIQNYDYHLVYKWKNAIKHHLWERIKPHENSIKTQLEFEMFASEVISAFIFGVKHEGEIHKDDIYEIAAKALKILE